MISRVRGERVDWNEKEQSVEVEVGGLVYEVRLPTICWRALRDKDQQELNLFTHYHVPDRAPTPVLIGFQRPTERDFFRKLLTVDSMGVTKAQRALAASVSTIARWIEAGDRRALSGLPGIGLRQADKIIAELRGKLVEEALLQDEGFDGADAPATTRAPDQVAADTVDALIGLGYQRREAERWVAELAPVATAADTTESMLRAVLQRLGSDA